jgi:hypothetical protein
MILKAQIKIKSNLIQGQTPIKENPHQKTKILRRRKMIKFQTLKKTK